MPLVVEVSRNEELDDGPPGDYIPNSTSAAEYDVLQRYTNRVGRYFPGVVFPAPGNTLQSGKYWEIRIFYVFCLI